LPTKRQKRKTQSVKPPAKLRTLDLFSGIGGFSVGLERTGGFETVAFCEIDPFCQRVLYKHWPAVPIFDNVKLLRKQHVGEIDVLCGGFPCQPFSQAGKRGGENDDRNLWPEMYRLLVEFRPRWFIAENVAGLVTMGLDETLSCLEAENYTTTTFVLPACALGLEQKRERVLLVANSKSIGVERHRSLRVQKSQAQVKEAILRCDRAGEGPSERAPEPNVGRMATRLPTWVDQIKALGNAVNPAHLTEIGYGILAVEQALLTGEIE
tara:strand:- start:54821 stop:55618 length:798 start_codon:yes stop_codon:yes gene_type:complete